MSLRNHKRICTSISFLEFQVLYYRLVNTDNESSALIGGD